MIMFARLTIVHVKKDKLDETVKLYEKSVVPAAKSQKGYRGTYLLTDRNTGKGVSIAFWDSKEDLIASEDSGYYKEQLSKFKDYFAAPPVREIYAVSVKD